MNVLKHFISSLPRVYRRAILVEAILYKLGKKDRTVRDKALDDMGLPHSTMASMLGRISMDEISDLSDPEHITVDDVREVANELPEFMRYGNNTVLSMDMSSAYRYSKEESTHG